MLPSLVARDIEEGLKSFVRDEFPIASKGFRNRDGKNVIEAYLEKPHSLVKGPWVEVKLPFREAPEGVSVPFTNLTPEMYGKSFRPYKHQVEAFQRLQWKAPKSTIVATGTGSGKTECFLYPILDYCLACEEEGIKAILIYPMNALASDQGKRLAKLISRISRAGKQLRAAVYTGDSDQKSPVMTEERLISDRNVIRRSPPDILLTNYKMLDYLLLRPEDQPLWEKTKKGVLKFLVADELHTYDGAQGTDLSCLIRRLKDRIGAGEDELACVGTSATIGGEGSIDRLCEFATAVFGTEVKRDAVIQEDRLDPDEYLARAGDCPPEGRWPGRSFSRIDMNRGEAIYIQQAVKQWFGDAASRIGFDGYSLTLEARERLAQHLPRLEAFRKFIRDASGVAEIRAIAERWEAGVDSLKDIARTKEERIALISRMAESLVALISEARLPFMKDGKDAGMPFLQVRSQLWIRVLRRAVATVGQEPELALADDLLSLSKPLAMPLVGCRECEQAAWGGVIKGGLRGGTDKVRPDLKLFYDSWFGRHQDTQLFYPVTNPEFARGKRRSLYLLCPSCGKLELFPEKAKDEDIGKPDRIPACGCGEEKRVTVWIPDMTGSVQDEGGEKSVAFVNRCPCCGAKNSLRIFGASDAALTSAAFAHVHASGFNADHKIIAFSDSVQDAAQRAGFAVARNYQSVTRHALVAYMKDKGGDGVGLRPLLTELPAYWMDRLKKRHPKTSGTANENEARADFLSLFVPPDMQWRQAWKHFSETVAGNSLAPAKFAEDEDWMQLLSCARQRLVWEALSELGFRSAIGRTVTRTNSAAIYPDPGLFQDAAYRFASRFEVETGLRASEDKAEPGSFHVTEERARAFLFGIADRMRSIGAFIPDDIGAPAVTRDFGEFLKDGKDFLHFNMSAVLPTYGKIFRPPTGLALAAAPRDKFTAEILSKAGSRETWHEAWARKFFEGGEPGKLNAAIFQAIYLFAMECLERAGLVRPIPRGDGTKHWGLSLDPWTATNRMTQFRCSCCGKVYHAAYAARSLYEGLSCYTEGCPGTLAEEGLPKAAPVYESAPFRVNAHEHTSLVDGETRRKVENSFGGSQELWSVNLLSATPTLEMGIDIGSLSTVVQCSMPPGQANYFQRIGRAGRRDGNALALTFADRDPHSQYFWQDPGEMIQGEVKSPGVFLRAVSVLERQMIAYCLTEWVRAAGPGAKIPDKLGEAISRFEGGRAEVFPRNFIAWVAEKPDALYRQFMQLFSLQGRPILSPEEAASLRDFVSGAADSDDRPSLALRINDCLRKQQADREALRRNRNVLQKRQRELEKRPPDEATRNELFAVKQQKAALEDLITENYTEKSFFNFMTDEGLLPNYAFPEEGVKVNSVIIKRHEPKDPELKDEEKPKSFYRPYKFEFSRSAAAALGELSPQSTFYANGYKLHVDQVVRDEKDEASEHWRLCDKCSYAVRELPGQPVADACPRCGSPKWKDLSRVHRMLQLRQVIAHSDSRRDRIGDDSETRVSVLQARQTLIDVDPRDVMTPWTAGGTGFPFGFEFVRSATIREINFGPVSDITGLNDLEVAGRKMPQHGFRICSCCGMVKKDFLRRGEKQHDFGCKYRDMTELELANENPWGENFFLFREVKSEAIRVRLPINEEADPEGARVSEQSLLSAFALGLRRHFKGDVSHLKLTLQTEPARDASEGKTLYLVIYDSVPGGTGYLKDLMRGDGSARNLPRNMVQLLREAYDAVARCECAKDPAKDGCYHCVYQARDASLRRRISRSRAEQLLAQMIAVAPEQYESRKISEKRSDGWSELERLFTHRLSEMPGFALAKHPMPDCLENWELRVELTEDARSHWAQATGIDPGDTFVWRLRAQTDLRRENGYLCASRPDFTFEPFQARLLDRFPRLRSEVFTDGWTYHAGILEDDTRKRQAVLCAGERVWSLTWADVQDAMKPDRRSFAGPLFRENQREAVKKKWGLLFGKQGAADEAAADARALFEGGLTSFDWLLSWLKDPFGFEARMKRAAAFGMLTQELVKKPARKSELERFFARPLAAQEFGASARYWARQAQQGEKTGFALAWNAVGEKVAGSFRLATAVRIDEAPFMKDGALGDSSLRDAWAAFWQTANAFQFGDYLWICTAGNESDMLYDRLPIPPAPEPDISSEGDWEELIADLDEDSSMEVSLALAEKAMAAGLRAPDDYGIDGGADWEEAVSAPLGFRWDAAGGPVYLFPKEGIFRKSLPAVQAVPRAIVADDGSRWLNELRAALAG